MFVYILFRKKAQNSKFGGKYFCKQYKMQPVQFKVQTTQMLIKGNEEKIRIENTLVNINERQIFKVNK